MPSAAASHGEDRKGLCLRRPERHAESQGRVRRPPPTHAPRAKLEAYKTQKGWSIPWFSSFGSDFNYDFHVTLDPKVAPVEYNYRSQRRRRPRRVTPFSWRARSMALAYSSGSAMTFSTPTRYTREAPNRSRIPTASLTHHPMGGSRTLRIPPQAGRSSRPTETGPNEVMSVSCCGTQPPTLQPPSLARRCLKLAQCVIPGAILAFLPKCPVLTILCVTSLAYLAAKYLRSSSVTIASHLLSPVSAAVYRSYLTQSRAFPFMLKPRVWFPHRIPDHEAWECPAGNPAQASHR